MVIVTLLPDGRIMITIQNKDATGSDVYYIDKDNHRYSELKKHAVPLYEEDSSLLIEPLPTENKKRRYSIISLFLVLLFVLGYIVYSILYSNNTSLGKTIVAQIDPKAHTVLYEIEGTARVVSIIYSTHGVQVSATNLAVPVMTLTGVNGVTEKMHSGDIMKITATDTTDSGTLTCRISLDGAQRVQLSSLPAQHGVTCFGGVIP